MTTVVTEDADFYMLWTKRGHKPRFTHKDYTAALAEAIRLAGENPGAKFVILHAIGKVHVQEAGCAAAD